MCKFLNIHSHIFNCHALHSQEIADTIIAWYTSKAKYILAHRAKILPQIAIHQHKNGGKMWKQKLPVEVGRLLWLSLWDSGQMEWIAVGHTGVERKWLLESSTVTNSQPGVQRKQASVHCN